MRLLYILQSIPSTLECSNYFADILAIYYLSLQGHRRTTEGEFLTVGEGHGVVSLPPTVPNAQARQGLVLTVAVGILPTLSYHDTKFGDYCCPSSFKQRVTSIQDACTVLTIVVVIVRACSSV